MLLLLASGTCADDWKNKVFVRLFATTNTLQPLLQIKATFNSPVILLNAWKGFTFCKELKESTI